MASSIDLEVERLGPASTFARMVTSLMKLYNIHNLLLRESLLYEPEQ
jgi:hypothetical protein